MFKADIYIERRKKLRREVRSGVLLFLGNDESPMNYPANTYAFRQDSSFLYYWGLDFPGLAALIDIEEEKEIVFGDDLTVADIVWMGSQPSIAEKARLVGVRESASVKMLEEKLRKVVRQGRPVHFLPQYRAENIIRIERLLGIHTSQVAEHVSTDFTSAVVSQRSVKAPEEIEQIELAVNITGAMHTTAMKMSRPGMYEREVAGAIEGLAISMGGQIAFPVIFSIHGETLHNHHHGNQMKAGHIVVNDSGAESALHYAGDITRTIPVGGKFSERQREIYNIVLAAQEEALRMIKPGVRFKDVHLTSCKALARGMKTLGMMKGDIDDAVAAGAHALFFQCGLGHMMGLDVHDMENLGEQYIGYDETVQRDSQFGLCYLRMAKALRPGYVMTVEPGIYMIPELIDAWKAEKKFSQFINYDNVEQYRDFGGVRLEDDILVTADGYRVLGNKIPKSIEEVEALASLLN